MHPTLQRQLQRLGFKADVPPDAEGWSIFLNRISQTYQEGDQDRYLLERSLAISNDELRQVNSVQSRILDNSTVGIAFVRHQHFEWVNPRLPEIFGIPADKLLGAPIRLLFASEEDYESSTQKAYELMSQGQKAHLEVRLLRGDGSPFWCWAEGNALHPSSPQDGTVWIWEDITAQKEAEDELKRVNQIQSLILDNTSVGIAFVKNRVFEWVNPRLPEILGLPMEEVQGKSTRILYGDAFNFQEAGIKAYESLATGAWYEFEAALNQPKGFPRHSRITGKALDPSQPHAGSIWLFEDITERRKSEEALRQGQKLESLGVLAGGIAHDFNNLLTAILGNLQLAQMELEGEEAPLSSLENAAMAALKASDLTKQLLAYSGKGRFIIKPHNLNQVVHEMTKLLRVSIHKKIDLAFELAEELPLIEADNAQLQQVLLNLVTNASDAMEEQEGRLSIRTRWQRLEASDISRDFPSQNLQPGTFVVLEVSDTGCGISPEVMERIFDPFFTTKSTGRGLGLSAMLGILRSHNAGLRIETQVGQGTTFFIYFPTSLNPEVLTFTPHKQPEAQFEGRLLLVDDEESILGPVSRLLENLGFTVDTARDGQQAIEQLRQPPSPYRLVLMDLSMPRMGGRETFEAIQHQHPSLPVILSSGYDEQQLVNELMKRGLAGFLPKPYQIQDLRQVITKVIEGASASKAEEDGAHQAEGRVDVV